MSKQCYRPHRFGLAKRQRIADVNMILDEYSAAGYVVTLRQLYYQLVSRDIVPNSQKEYEKLVGLMTEARLAGEVDWDAIVDRTRNLRQLSTWESPADGVRSLYHHYREDLWAPQPVHVEVWVEKEALLGVIEQPCNMLRVPYFACKGYNSIAEMRDTALRFRRYQQAGKEVVLLYMGDHDPSGVDMSGDVKRRLDMFIGGHDAGDEDEDDLADFFFLDDPDDPDDNTDVEVRRIALTMEQVEQYRPPPNPIKKQDLRAAKYFYEYGDSSWELDALPPDALTELIEKEVLTLRDADLWEAAVKGEKANRQRLDKVADELEDSDDDLDAEYEESEV